MGEINQVDNENLRIMVFDSCKELGEKVNDHLLNLYKLDKKKYTFMVPIKENFFEDGHLKVEIGATVRGTDIFMLTDIGNYSLEYNMHGLVNHTSPNDLFMELKDGIGACNRHADKINIIMPLLYSGRQHRRNTRESLACGAMLHELDETSRVRSLLTFDAHDEGVEHAVHNMEFDNFYATNVILESFINDLSIDDLTKLVFVAPDSGATGRRNVYLNSFQSSYIDRQAGNFTKLRDYNNLVNGKYEIIGHDYSGKKDLEEYTAIVIDDMISSGGSMFDVINELNKMGIKKIYIITTYCLFTRGVDEFNSYYKKGILSGVYTTNLSYIPKEFLKCKWLHVCDCSKLIADIIYHIHNNMSISGILRDKSYPVKLIEEKFRNK